MFGVIGIIWGYRISRVLEWIGGLGLWGFFRSLELRKVFEVMGVICSYRGWLVFGWVRSFGL